MLIIATILLIIVCIGIWYFGEWCEGFSYESRSKNFLKRELYYKSDEIKGVGGTLGFVAAFMLVIMLIVLVICHIGTDATVNKYNERYKALTYKVESGTCRDEFGLLSKEVIDEIQAWNESVVNDKGLQNDLWIGVFVPDIYDEFETIDYERYVR